MKSMRLWLAGLTAAALLAGGPALAQDQKAKKTVSFGVLSAMEADKAQAEAKTWLQTANPAAMTKFEAIWKQTNRTVLDRLAETFALGDPAAAKLLAEARNPLASAPTEVPALLKNEKNSPFFRNNLALAYANLLTHRRVFEQGLEILKTTKAELVADPGAYLFCRAVCEHGLLNKEEAKGTIDRLLGDVVDIQDRYKTVSVLMLLDMETWKSKDLGAVARLMDNSQRMLELARGGPNTQKVQKEIVYRLDELIKEMEKQAKDKEQKDGEGKPGDPNGGACPNGGQPGSGSGDKPGNQPGNQPGANPTAPLQQSQIAKNGGQGNVDKVDLRKKMEQWGNLPPAERQQILQQLTQDLSPADRAIIENYLRNLSKTQSKQK